MKPTCITYTNIYEYNLQPSLRARRSQPRSRGALRRVPRSGRRDELDEVKHVGSPAERDDLSRIRREAIRPLKSKLYSDENLNNE